MNVTSDNEADIKLDGLFQPVVKHGSVELVSGDECMLQDILIESECAEGEVFDEADEADEAYGFGMIDFVQSNLDESERNEIIQRIKEKLTKRECVDEGSIRINFQENNINVLFQKVDDENAKYDFDIETNQVEVEVSEDA